MRQFECLYSYCHAASVKMSAEYLAVAGLLKSHLRLLMHCQSVKALEDDCITALVDILLLCSSLNCQMESCV